MTDSVGPMPRGSSTICLPFRKEDYVQIIDDPSLFRSALDQAFQDMPELFPKAFEHGYSLKDSYFSEKAEIRLRRIQCKTTGEAFTVRPSFVMPYMTANTDDVAKPLFLRKFGVPYWALTEVFGRNDMFWYRLETALGRNSIVGTTVRQADLPKHLVADEHHQTLNGEKVYVATTVAEGCCLGAEVSATADEAGLSQAYGVFKQEATNVEADYQPETVNTDGWPATRAAWQYLWCGIILIRCFLHGWLNIRARGKHLQEVFKTLGDKVWNVFRATNPRCMAQRLRRLREWAKGKLTGVVLAETLKLCDRAKDYSKAYEHPGCQRTSNMLDRVMRGMNGYLEAGQHLHGHLNNANRRCRAWALVHNFTPWSPATRKANDQYECPAERLNQHRYHDNWLHNLLVSASLAGFRR